MDLTKNQQLIAYLGEKHPGATITVLIKLAYFVDLVSVKRTGNPISSFEYVRYFYGPFAPSIYTDLEALMQANIFKAELNYSSSGEEYTIYSFIENSQIDLDGISVEEKELIDGVLKSVQGYGAKTLTDMAYKTKPMTSLGATLGGSENLNKILDLNA